MEIIKNQSHRMNQDYHVIHPTHELPKNATHTILQNNDAFIYHKLITSYKPTPLIELRCLAQKLEVNSIYVKDESYRFGLNAFKGLGASYAVYKTLQEHPNISTMCTATDGNHGKAVAWASKQFNKKAIVYVPKNTSISRIEAIQKEGAQVEKLDLNYDDTCTYAKQRSEANGLQLIQDTAWDGYEKIPALIMAGYLTCLKELETSLHKNNVPDVDIVFLQVGVGSWAAAAVWYYVNKYGANRPKIVLVEPTESDGMMESLKQGIRVIPKGTQQTIMAGLNCGIPSLNAWEIIKDNIDACISIEDFYVENTMNILYNPNGTDSKIIAGESGASGMAAFFKILNDPKLNSLKKELNIDNNINLLFFNTEGNTDPINFNKIINS